MTINKKFKLIISLLIIGVLLNGCFSGVTHVTGVEIEEGDEFVVVGETIQLSAVIEPMDATNTNISWESDDITKVTVNENGLVEAIKKGSAEVTVITEDGGFEDTIVIYVVDSESNITDNTCDPCNTCEPECDPCDPCGGCYDLCECETDTCDTCDTCNTCEPDTCDPCDPCGGCYDLIECETDTCNICEPECNPCDPDSDCYNPCDELCNTCDPCNTCEPECDPCDPCSDCYNQCECETDPCNTCDPCA